MKQIDKIALKMMHFDSSSWETLTPEIKKLEEAAKMIDIFQIDEAMKKFGCHRIIRILAYRIVTNPCDFDSSVIEIARQVPFEFERAKGRMSCMNTNLHRIKVQDYFMKYINLFLI